MSRVLRLFASAAVLFVTLPMAASKHEEWFEAQSPNFVVVCNGGEKKALQTAKVFEQIRAVFRQSIPSVSKRPSPRITVIAVKNDDGMKALLPEYWTKGHMHPAGLFEYGMNLNYAAIELDAPGDNPYATIYHEYYHSVTMPYFPNLPLWVAEGMAEFYGNTQIEGNEAGMGYAYPDLIEELKTDQFISLDKLFKVDASSPYYNEENKSSIFYAESWALVHYLMVGDKATHRQMFSDYLKALDEGATQDEAGTKAFGNLQKLQNNLLTYIHESAFYYIKSALTTKVSDSDIKIRAISDAEAEAFQGGFLATRGRTQEARPVLEDAIRQDPKLALAYQNLALVEFTDRHPDEALALATKAIELDPENGLARYLRADLAFRSGTQVSENFQLEDDLRVAIAADPDFAPAYSMLALRLAASHEDMTEALKMAQKAVSLEPGNGTYQLSLAQVLARMRKFDEAKIAGSRARASARTPSEKAQAESFLSYLAEYRRADEGAITVDSSSGNEATAPSAAQASESDSEDLEEATGVVTKGSCEMGGPKLEVKTDSGTIVLHAPLNGGIQILMKKPVAGFNPCTSLTGAKVNVTYKADESNRSSGTLKRIEILEAPGANGDGN